jgi:hypothetical protein
LIKEHGYDPETLGILGRVHKDRYKELKKNGDIMASAALDDAIDAYTKGFISDPRDYYPGVNAVTILGDKTDYDEQVASVDSYENSAMSHRIRTNDIENSVCVIAFFLQRYLRSFYNNCIISG